MRRGFESSDPLRRAPARRIPPAGHVRPVNQSRPATPQLSQGALRSPASIVGPPVGLTGPTQPESNAQSSGTSVVEGSEQYDEFPLRAGTQEDMKDSRYHLLKFQSRQSVDPTTHFTAPIKFSRKDPKFTPNAEASEAGTETEEPVKKPNPFARRKKTHQVQGGDEKADAARKLRYEEHYPWVMEDFDAKNAWISSYEAAQSDTYVIFVFDRDGFKMIPVEKWYKMSQRSKYTTLSLEEAEERMNKKGGTSRWVMDKFQPDAAGISASSGLNGPLGANGQTRRRLRTVEGSEERGARGLDEDADYEEEFADDEEAPIMEGPEEDVKEVEDRIKQEQRQVGGVSENPDDIDALFDEDDKAQMDKNGKKLKKYLRSLEKNANYDSDDEENPYMSESDSDSEPEIKEEADAAGNAIVGGRVDGSIARIALPFKKKKIKRQAHGMVVLQLPPRILDTFPKGVWNPSVPLREASVEAESRPDDTMHGEGMSGVELASGSTAGTRAGSRSASPKPRAQDSEYAAANTSDTRLLSSEDVRAAILGGATTIDELIVALKQKLRQHSDNKKRLKAILIEIAQFKTGKLSLL